MCHFQVANNDIFELIPQNTMLFIRLEKEKFSLIDYDTHIVPLKYRDKWLATMKIKLIVF